MNDFFATLLQAVLIAAVSVIAAFFCKAVRAVAKYLGDKSENESAQWYLDEVAEAISNAVTFTSQTYVDELKKDGQFTKENQEWALNVALSQAKLQLTEEIKDFLEDAYGPLDRYLEGRIEAEVRRQKLDQPATLALPVLDSTPDTTAASIDQVTTRLLNAEVLPGTPLE